jgi:hypothetical protein
VLLTTAPVTWTVPIPVIAKSAVRRLHLECSVFVFRSTESVVRGRQGRLMTIEQVARA